MAQTIGDSKLLDAWASDGEIEEPDISKIEQGWLLGEQPPHEFFNWIQNTFGQKINHVLQRGVASWDSDKDYEAGDVVGSGVSVWIAQDTNTNSEPGASNTDWVRVITADDVATTADAGIVELATDAETQSGTSDSVAVTPSAGAASYALLSGGSGANFTTMPQVGGDPIVEQVSNSNGNYIRFASGLQICVSVVIFVTMENGITMSSGVLRSGAAGRTTWLFPATFNSSRIALHANLLGGAGDFTAMPSAGGVETDSAEINLYHFDGGNSSGDSQAVRVSAIGFWG